MTTMGMTALAYCALLFIEAELPVAKVANDLHLVIATYILGAVGFLQLVVFGYQAIQLRRTVNAAIGQSEDMKRSIAEASRSASAMEQVAAHIETSAKAAIDSVAALRERTAQQMRAYLTVVVGAALYQDRHKGIRFEGKPMLINTGHTPAHKVRYRAKGAIFPIPLPAGFVFPPLPILEVGAAVLGPQQNATLSAIVDGFVPDQDVEDIKHIRRGQSLYVWGVVEYEDIFDENHFINFCQQLSWLPDDEIWGVFVPGHNDSN
jgi:hypothetical protein